MRISNPGPLPLESDTISIELPGTHLPFSVFSTHKNIEKKKKSTKACTDPAASPGGCGDPTSYTKEEDNAAQDQEQASAEGEVNLDDKKEWR